jgi:hypothetical protein
LISRPKSSNTFQAKAPVTGNPMGQGLLCTFAHGDQHLFGKGVGTVVTAAAHEDQTEQLVELVKIEARALFQISRICTITNPEEGEHNVVVFDIDFDEGSE